MEKKSVYEAGEQIRNMVQNAVDSGDFSKLSDSITQVINDAVDGIHDGLTNRAQGRYEYSGDDAAERIRRELDEKRKQAVEKIKNTKMEPTLPSETAGVFMQTIGYILMVSFGLPFAFFLLGSVLLLEPSVFLVSGIFGGLTWLSWLLVKKGKRKRRLAKHFRLFHKIIGDRKFCKIAEFAHAVGEKNHEVCEELREMIINHWFSEGYMDEEESFFITDYETYTQYCGAKESFETRTAQAKKKKAKEAPQSAEQDSNKQDLNKKKVSDLPPQCQEIIATGQKYIRHIRECNEKIPGEEISGKLSHLEHTVSRIFAEVEKNPSSAGDLKKMMNYYLPTTAKLLDAYCELDAQAVKGKNIDGTKREIELALDTINVAFENLLDNLFQDQAWDISSDISVLNTMLAQEGLTGSAFEQMAQKQE